MKLTNRGQFSGQTLIYMAFLGILFFVYLQMYRPIVIDQVFPLLDNIAYGTVIRVMFELGPFVVAMLILAYPLLSQKQQYQGAY